MKTLGSRTVYQIKRSCWKIIAEKKGGPGLGTSLMMVYQAPIPFATFGNKEQSMMGQNYLRSLFALGFQGFLIMVCVGIYAVLIQSVAFSTDIIASLWKVMGFTILLAFTLFKTRAVAKSVLHAH